MELEPTRSCVRRYLHDWLHGAGIVPRTTLSVGSYLAMIACVAAGTGAAVAPRSVLDRLAPGETLRRHPLPAPMTGIRTLLAWRRGWRSARLDALIALLPAA